MLSIESNAVADQALSLRDRILAASAFVDPKEFALQLVETEGVDPQAAYFAVIMVKMDLSKMES